MIKKITQTVITLSFLGLVFWVTIAEDEISVLKAAINKKDITLGQKDSTIKFYGNIHLGAIELDKIVESNSATRRTKKENQILKQLNFN